MELVKTLLTQNWLPTYKAATNDPNTFIRNLFNLAIILVAVVAVAFLIYAGFQFITARGDTSQAETAQKTIMYAIIGLIVALAAAVLVNMVWKYLTKQPSVPDITL